MSYINRSESKERAAILSQECNDNGTPIRFHSFNPSNRIIDRIFNRFYVEEECENWFDEYPEKPHLITWQDPIACGIWDMSQHTVDESAKSIMRFTKSIRGGKRNRFFYAWNEKEQLLHIVWYGRDRGAHFDVWWAMKPRRDKRVKV